MGCPIILILGITKIFLIVSVIFITEKVEGKASESPQYILVHSESDFEVRFYRDSAWMTAPVDEISFEKATKNGFHRLFQYTEGANLNFSRIPMTKPVLTSIVPGAGPLHSSAYIVKFYLPVGFQAGPPLPLPELNLEPDWSKGHCIAVRKFSGFARDNNIVKEAEKLAVSLSRSKWANSTSTQSEYAYAIAQYNSPFKFVARVNEVWVDVSESEEDEKVEGKASESPQYILVHSESDFEVRFYRDSAWMTAPVDEISFEKATKDGFHRLFQYTEGANLNFSRIAMTKPVLTSIVHGAGPLHSSAYIVKFYLPVGFQAGPPLPLPELNLEPDRSKGHCIAVRKFSGFARDNNIVKEAEKLAVSLSRSKWANSTSTQSEYAYAIAQYNSPFKFVARVNEVWVDVSESEEDGCKPDLFAAY